MNMFNILLYINKAIIFFIPVNYFYFKNGTLINISIIVYLLNFLLVGFFINSYIFDDKIYCIKNNKIWISTKKNKKKKIYNKIVKNIIYIDYNYILLLDNLKKNIHNIDNNIEITFLLKYFNNLKFNRKSLIKINFYNSKSKLINLNEKTIINDLFI